MLDCAVAPPPPPSRASTGPALSRDWCIMTGTA
jgi:hypothetical protein